MRGVATLVVGEDDTAIAIGSGSVPVLATPRVIALCEAATCAAIETALTEGTTSVGVRVELDHIRATPVGRRVGATATVVAVDGPRITFEVTASELDAADEGVVGIAVGVVHRVLVDRARFLR